MNTSIAKTENKTLKPADEIRSNLNKMSGEFGKLLPPNVTAERFIRIAMTAIQESPALLSADRQSLFVACTKAATDQLLPDGRQGAIIPYKGKAKWMPMIAGICQRVKQSGELKTLDAVVVYENDKYRYWVNGRTGPDFEYEPAKEEQGKPILTFAYAITLDGGLYFEQITESQMEEIENCSSAKEGPWKGPFRDEMKRKSALRRLAKYRLPVSSDVLDMIQREDDLYELPKQNAVYTPPDYLPGIEPKTTAENFVKENKDLPNAAKVFEETLAHLYMADDKTPYERLKAELVKQKIQGFE